MEMGIICIIGKNIIIFFANQSPITYINFALKILSQMIVDSGSLYINNKYTFLQIFLMIPIAIHSVHFYSNEFYKKKKFDS